MNDKAKLPLKKRVGDAGYDVFSCEDKVLLPGERYQFKLGLAIEFSPLYCVVVQERSGMALNSGILTIGNVIDSNYRGEISAILFNSGKEPINVVIGDRIAQLLILPIYNELIEQVDTLSESNRGAAGYGSSGK